MILTKSRCFRMLIICFSAAFTFIAIEQSNVLGRHNAEQEEKSDPITEDYCDPVTRKPANHVLFWHSLRSS